MNTNETLVEQLSSLLVETVEAKARAGRRGYHCLFCGAKDEFVVCRCGHGNKFGCGQMKTFTCRPCAEAHCFIAERLSEMFAMPIVNRVRSRRERAFWLLRRACGENVCEGDLRDIKHRQDNERLFFYLCQAHPLEDTPEQFESKVLKAFGRARFLSWQGLVAEYKRQSEEDAIAGLMRLDIG